MRVLVTGGFGFVGYAVTRALDQAGHEVTVLARTTPPDRRLPEGTKIVHADIRHLPELAEALNGRSFDGVCHLAGLARVRDSFDHPLDYFRTNDGGTANLLSILAESRQPPHAFVLASTGAVYGSAAEGAITEDVAAIPESPYAASKRAAEQLALNQARTGAIGTSVLRCFSISGMVNGLTDGDDTRVITKALHVAAGRAPSMVINGDGSAQREFTHVLDVADAYVRVLEATKRGDERVYNVGTGNGVSVSAVLETVESVTGRRVAVEHGPARDEPHLLVADATRIRHDIGWSAPRSDLESIVRDAWDAVARPTRATLPS